MSWTILLGLLPYAFQIIAFILQRINASQATIAAFQALVESSKNDGLISVQASDKFKSLHDQLMAKFKETPNGQNAPGTGNNKGT